MLKKLFIYAVSLLTLLGFQTMPSVLANYTDSKPRGTKSSPDNPNEDLYAEVEGFKGQTGSNDTPVQVFVSGKAPDPETGSCADGKTPAMIGYRSKVCLEDPPYTKGLTEIFAFVPGKSPTQEGDRLVCEDTAQLNFKDEPVYYGTTPVCVVQDFLDPDYKDSKYGSVAVTAYVLGWPAELLADKNGKTKPVCGTGHFPAVHFGLDEQSLSRPICPAGYPGESKSYFEPNPYADARIKYYDAKNAYEKTSKDDPDYGTAKATFEYAAENYSDVKTSYYDNKSKGTTNYIDSKKYLSETLIDYRDAKAAYIKAQNKPTYTGAKETYEDLKIQYEQAKSQFESKAGKASPEEVKSAVDEAQKNVKKLRAALRGKKRVSVSYKETFLEYRAALQVLRGAKFDRTKLLKSVPEPKE